MLPEVCVTTFSIDSKSNLRNRWGALNRHGKDPRYAYLKQSQAVTVASLGSPKPLQLIYRLKKLESSTKVLQTPAPKPALNL